MRVTDSAAAVDEDYAGFRTGRIDHFENRLARDRLRRAVCQRQHCLPAQRRQDDSLALPGRGGGAERVREGARADQCGVADASEEFAGDAAGRGRGRDCAIQIDGNRADGAVAAIAARAAA